MELKHHTIILVPHERAQFRKWRISNRQVWVIASTFAAVTLAAAFITVSFFSTRLDQNELASIRQENEQLKQANSTFEQSLSALRSQLGEYENRTRKLAIVAGLENPPSGGEGGVGGVETPANSDAHGLRTLAVRVDSLSSSLSQVEQRLEDRSRWISATPAIAPVKGIVTSAFGIRRDPINGNLANHLAIDIAAPAGKPVLAAADGLVTRSGMVPGGLGIAVFLAHGYGLTTHYGHMSRINVKPGQHVKRGDVIGFVGNTGRATGYHLHYEVWQDGKPVDPIAYILDAGRGSS
ncbi:MAG: peptidoglycan DD-metalloendopeptidase family protein [Acidobacteriota bacterium]